MIPEELLSRYVTGEPDFASFDFPDGVDFSGMTLDGASLRGVCFHGAHVKCADFRGADLTNADFYGALVEGVLLESAILTGTCFIRAWFCGVQLQEGDTR
jgi:uncharacterized protein YjbI with pentapeptide repeats